MSLFEADLMIEIQNAKNFTLLMQKPLMRIV